MHVLRVSLTLILTFAFTTLGFAQSNTGRITGQVIDQANDNPLPGANVIVQDTDFGAATGSNGEFRITGVPTGTYTVEVSYLGYETETTQITVQANTTAELDFELTTSYVEADQVIVEAIREGQSRALNQQRTADNIKNVVSADLVGRFPDPNVAEALQRIPGISVQRDQGEGRYVQIRGTNPNLSNISINGEQIPSPEGDVRFVALDMVPSDVLQSIEVNKAITPDMDGDAIGGSVNLNTLSAFSGQQVFNATLATEYNTLVQDLSPFGGQASVNYGQRLGAENRLGVMLGASYHRSNRASNNNEMEYDGGAIDELQLRDYELTRERAGITTSLDYRINSNSELFFNGMYNYFTDQEWRRRGVFAADEIGREVKDRLEIQQIMSFSGGGRHPVGGMDMDYQLSYSYADQFTPSDQQTVFLQEFDDDRVQFDRSDPDYPRWNIDGTGQDLYYQYSQFEFDEYENSSELTNDQHFTSRINFVTPYSLGDMRGEFKFGGLFRDKTKMRDPDIEIYGYEGNIGFSDVRGGFEDEEYLFDEYKIGVFPDPDEVHQIFENNRNDFVLDEESSIEDSKAEEYEAGETTTAGYAMTKLVKGKLSSIIGARFENITTDYFGHTVEFDANGDLLPVRDLEEDNQFDFLLPMIHLNYRPTQITNLRFAWTNTFAKPNYFDLAPYRIIVREDEEIELGNPDLDATTAMNFDLMGEYYLSSVGLLSAGVFYKDITDFIYISNFNYDDPADLYDGYEATQPVNGDAAQVAGIELNIQQQLTFLPGWLSGLGVYANYTYTWSEAEIQVEEGITRTVTLPGQAENVGNLALSYEKFGISARISAHYSGAFIDELRATTGEDRYYDERLQLDFSGSYRLTPNLRVFLEALNLTNAPLRYYNGITSRPEQREFYSSWARLGLKYNF